MFPNHNTLQINLLKVSLLSIFVKKQQERLVTKNAPKEKKNKQNEENKG